MEQTPMSQQPVRQINSSAEPDIQVRAPMVVDASQVWFSVYGFGWGYAAYSLPARAVVSQLGAANESPKQMTLAFELGKRRVRQAVQSIERPHAGERLTLSDVTV
jgi:hypothetical protein